jgi:hypothetical protein
LRISNGGRDAADFRHSPSFEIRDSGNSWRFTQPCPGAILVPVIRGFLALSLAACSAAPTSAENLAKAEPHFRALEAGSAEQAFLAIEDLTASWDDAWIPRLERTLAGPPRGAVLALDLIGHLTTAATARLLESRLPALLDSPALAGRAAVAAGLRGLKTSTLPLLEYYDKAEDAAALRALGRIWAQRLEAPPLPRRDEIDRLAVLRLVHRRAMGADPLPEAVEAMLRIMTREELEKFLSTYVPVKAATAGRCDAAVRRRDFDPVKGARIHEAFLSSPDLALVAEILATSPHRLREPLVAGFLDDRRDAGGGLLLCDAAARRLSGRPLPASRAERDALIRSLRM